MDVDERGTARRVWGTVLLIVVVAVLVGMLVLGAWAVAQLVGKVADTVEQDKAVSAGYADGWS